MSVHTIKQINILNTQIATFVARRKKERPKNSNLNFLSLQAARLRNIGIKKAI